MFSFEVMAIKKRQTRKIEETRKIEPSLKRPSENFDIFYLTPETQNFDLSKIIA